MPPLTNDRLDLTRLFIRIAETGQVSEAARSLGISQPTASRLLKQLETNLGASLFERTAQGLRPTQAGSNFLDPARQLMDQWQAAVDAIQAGTRAISGSIRVIAPVAVGQLWLAKVAAGFLRDHPGVSIDWVLNDDCADIKANGYDLWLRAGDLNRDDLVVRHVYHVERAVVSRTPVVVDHPRELRASAAVRLSPFVPGTIELTNAEGATFRLRQHCVFTTNNLFAARSAVLEGVGYAVLPLWCVSTHLTSGFLTKVCPTWQPNSFHFSIAYPPDRGRLPRVSALISYIRHELEDVEGFGNTIVTEATMADRVLARDDLTA